MNNPAHFSFQEYLASKKTVDDRALNALVWQTVKESLPAAGPARPLRVLEVGAGTGAMFARMLSRKLIAYAHYTALDAQPENTAFARQALPAWGEAHNFRVCTGERGELVFERGTALTHLALETGDLFDFAAQPANQGQYDLVAAHAVLDLLDIQAALPALLGALQAGGLFYFTLNFDGGTTFEPVIDPSLDSQIERLYHRTMDERSLDGRPSGDSRSGRHLFAQLQRAGATILAAGASDWVVFPTGGRYPAREAYFLHFIIQTVQSALESSPALDPDRFAAWVGERHAQIERGELVYIAHQLDFAGRYAPLNG